LKEWGFYGILSASYYPNLAIVNKVYPKHLSETFCDVYEDVYIQRKGFAKGTSENATMKLALNGVYGDSNSKFSPFYDSQYTMTITISGQLSLCMLSEKLLEIEGLDIIQINTDGVTVRVPRDRVDDHVKICEDWEKLTGLELERNDYNSMYIRDVNNYIAEYTNGSLKRKGAYEYEDLDWSKNHSGLIIQMAAVAYLTEGKPVQDTIRNHKDKMDFMMRVKVPRSSRLITKHNRTLVGIMSVMKVMT
jgi:DNA polymerase elongation subunit (family B)